MAEQELCRCRVDYLILIWDELNESLEVSLYNRVFSMRDDCIANMCGLSSVASPRLPSLPTLTPCHQDFVGRAEQLDGPTHRMPPHHRLLVPHF